MSAERLVKLEAPIEQEKAASHQRAEKKKEEREEATKAR